MHAQTRSADISYTYITLKVETIHTVKTYHISTIDLQSSYIASITHLLVDILAFFHASSYTSEIALLGEVMDITHPEFLLEIRRNLISCTFTHTFQ